MRTRRQTSEINAGSLADVAFLMLIFFLVVTTIDQDQGILIKLPPFSPNDPVELNESRVFSIKVNSSNEILVEGKQEEITNIHQKTFDFLNLKFNNGIQPVISIQTDRKTNYSRYLSVYNEILLGYKNLWNDYAKEHYNSPYTALNKTGKNEIRKKFPMIISEAEPVDLGN